MLFLLPSSFFSECIWATREIPRLFGVNLRDSWVEFLSALPSLVIPCCLGKYESSLGGKGTGECLDKGDKDLRRDDCLDKSIEGLSYGVSVGVGRACAAKW